MNANVFTLTAVLTVFAAANIYADMQSSTLNEEQFVYQLAAAGYAGDWSRSHNNYDWDAVTSGFQIVVSKGASDTQVKFEFSLTQPGIIAGYANGNGVKFQNNWTVDNESWFTNNTITGTGGTKIGNDGTLAGYLSLVAGTTWDDFAAAVSSGELNLKIFGHLQSIDLPNGQTGVSINSGTSKAWFELVRQPASVTPEPATMLILGLGVMGLGLARRRK